MHPDVVFLADSSCAIQRVKGSAHCGPRCAAYKEWHCTLVGTNRNTEYFALRQASGSHEQRELINTVPNLP